MQAPAKAPTQLAAYRFWIEEKLMWGDMDAMQHVNNARYFRFTETARIEFLRSVFPETGNPSADLIVGMALAETRCRFKVPLTYPDDILISAGVADIQETEFLIRHEIYSRKLDCIAAEGDARMVFYDFNKGQRAELPDEVVERLNGHRIA